MKIFKKAKRRKRKIPLQDEDDAELDAYVFGGNFGDGGGFGGEGE